jgi:hypothetical protein
MAFEGEDEWRVTVFQIDERDAEGRWIGPEGNDPSALSGGGVLSSGDQIVFRADELGVRVSRTAWPEGATEGAEIEVRDPIDGGRGWAYLFLFDEPPEIPATDHIHYEALPSNLGETLFTPYYRVIYAQYGRSAGPHIMTGFGMDGRGRGRRGPDFLDRMKVRYEGRLHFLPGLGYKRDESDFPTQSLLNIHGPLRVVRDIERRMRLPLAWDVNLWRTTLFRQDRIIINAPDQVPPRARFVVGNLEVRWSWDFIAPANSRIYAAPIPEGAAIDGRLEQIESSLDGSASPWWALVTPRTGTILALLEFPRGGSKNRDGSPHPVLFYRDEQLPDKPESTSGSLPGVGWRMRVIDEGKPNHPPTRIHLLLLDSFQPGDEKQWLDWIDTPLRITVGPGLPS